MSDSFDQQIYDAVMKKKYPFFRHDLDQQVIYDTGYHEAARVAARLNPAQSTPELPEGWHLSIIEIHKGGGYRCALYHDDLNYVDAVRPTWQEALVAAISQAEVDR